MSTRGPQRWCPSCKGQVYHHHAAKAGENLEGLILPADVDVWYCQGCGKLLAEDEALHSPDEKKKEVASGRPHR